MGLGEETIKAHQAPHQSRKFYTAWFCPFAHRVWIALEELELDYEWVECEIYHIDGSTKRSLPLAEKAAKNPAFVECCPRGLVPGWASGPDKIYESNVCLEYLAEVHDSPKKNGQRLLPPSPAARALVRTWVAHWGERVQPHYYKALMSPLTEDRETAKANLVKGLVELGAAMAPLADGPFFLGAQFSLFECVALPWWIRFASVLRHYRGFALPPAGLATTADAAALARVAAWGAACIARPSVARTIVEPARLVANNIGYANNTATSNCAQVTRSSAGISSSSRTAAWQQPSAIGALAAMIAISFWVGFSRRS